MENQRVKVILEVKDCSKLTLKEIISDAIATVEDELRNGKDRIRNKPEECVFILEYVGVLKKEV